MKEDAGMAKTVLLLGVRADLLETVQQELQARGVEFLSGTGEVDVEPALRKADVDHVIIGGGLALEARAATAAQDDAGIRALRAARAQLLGATGFQAGL